ncbi:MAG: hypothetical protein F4X65_06750 [Chloroflexi bacterium]|nr:hypothetical protein [Chloroflexota bacterium]
MGNVIEYSISPADYIRVIGPVIRINVQGRDGTALLDTGAAWSSIDLDLAESLLLPRGQSHETVSATGRGTFPTFGTNMYIPVLDFTVNGPIRSLPLRGIGHELDAVVGRDVICRYEFTMNAASGVIRFTEL